METLPRLSPAAAKRVAVIAERQGKPGMMLTMLVDPDSLPFVAGAEVDYVEKIGAAAFEVKNPQAASGCGCGSSFSI